MAMLIFEGAPRRFERRPVGDTAMDQALMDAYRSPELCEWLGEEAWNAKAADIPEHMDAEDVSESLTTVALVALIIDPGQARDTQEEARRVLEQRYIDARRKAIDKRAEQIQESLDDDREAA